MKLGVLFSGGKDSTLAAYVAKNEGYDLSCLITLVSENPDSFMFHTPSIKQTEKQAEVMELPIIIKKTKGKKEDEINDLKSAVKEAIDKFGIQGVVSGAVNSCYQASRIQRVCNELGVECFNPLWQKDQIELLNDLVKNGFHAVITGVFAEPFNDKWLLKEIDDSLISDISKLSIKYGINPTGEGGEYESLVLNCPLFSSSLTISNKKVSGEKNSWRAEIDLEK